MSYWIIPPRVPFVDPDGRVAREWFIFLSNVFLTLGSGQADVNLVELEGLVLGLQRGPNIAGIESDAREMAAFVQAQPGDRSAIDELRRRISDLEAQLGAAQRPPAAEDLQLTSDIQTALFGSRPWP